MAVICPAILAEDTNTYRQQMEKVAPFALRLQIDLTDGQFAPTKTVNLNEVWWPHTARADLHLMYTKPENYTQEIINLNPRLAIVHAEAEADFKSIARQLRDEGILSGLSVLPDTTISSVAKILPNFDHLLIFSGDLGRFGGRANLDLVDKVAEAKDIKPDIEIGWDGGINDQNAGLLAEKGVSVLNVGGFIQNAEDPLQVFATLNSIVGNG